MGNTNLNPLSTIKITKLQPLSIKHYKPNLETLTNNTKKPPQTHTLTNLTHTNSQSQSPYTLDKLSHTKKTNKLLTHKYEYLVGTTEALTLLVGNKTIFLKFVGCQKKKQAQDTKIYMENPFYLKGKTTVPTTNNSTIIKSIIIVYSQVYT